MSSTALWPYALPRDDPRHGTMNGYQNLRCRCDACRTAHTTYKRDSGSGSYKRDTCPECGGAKVPSSQRCHRCECDARRKDIHGTETQYTAHKCRCALCREAASTARRLRRQRGTTTAGHPLSPESDSDVQQTEAHGTPSKSAPRASDRG